MSSLLCSSNCIQGFDDFLRASNNISRQGKIVKDKGLITRYIKILILTKVEAN